MRQLQSTHNLLLQHLTGLMETIKPLKEELSSSITTCRSLENRIAECQRDLDAEKEALTSHQKLHLVQVNKTMFYVQSYTLSISYRQCSHSHSALLWSTRSTHVAVTHIEFNFTRPRWIAAILELNGIIFGNLSPIRLDLFGLVLQYITIDRSYASMRRLGGRSK